MLLFVLLDTVDQQILENDFEMCFSPGILICQVCLFFFQHFISEARYFLRA